MLTQIYWPGFWPVNELEETIREACEHISPLYGTKEELERTPLN